MISFHQLLTAHDLFTLIAVLQYPAGKNRMEPLGVVVFSVVMITSFSQILVESIQRLADRSISFIDLPYLAIGAMVTTVVVKAIVWLTYRSFESTSIRGKPGFLKQVTIQN